MVGSEAMKRYYLNNREKILEEHYHYRCKVSEGYFLNHFVELLVRQRDGNRCTKCSSTKNLVVHHKHYDLDKLTYYDLVTICRSCHKKEHKKLEEAE